MTDLAALKRYHLSELQLGPDELEAIQEVLDSNWLTMGPVTQKFEREFAALHGARFALAVTNCTAALHLALLALGVKSGDEVIVPSLTFVATVNAVRYCGATPVFADIRGAHDLTLDPDDVSARVTPRTRGVIVMHYGGFPADMEAFRSLAEARQLFLVEDAAHAPASFLEGRALGTLGDVGCFSFFSNKNMTTGEGGMLVTHRSDLNERMGLLRSHGMTSLTWERHLGHATGYDVVEVGFN